MLARHFVVSLGWRRLFVLQEHVVSSVAEPADRGQEETDDSPCVAWRPLVPNSSGAVWKHARSVSASAGHEESKDGTGAAVCVTGKLLESVPSIPIFFRKNVVDVLGADLFVVSPSPAAAFAAFGPLKGAFLGKDVDPFIYLDGLTATWFQTVSTVPGPWNGSRGRDMRMELVRIIDYWRCLQLIMDAEQHRGRLYQTVTWARLDLVWLQPHPLRMQASLQAADMGCWLTFCPQQDFGGIADHHAWCDRWSAVAYLAGRLRTLVDAVEQNAFRSWHHRCKADHVVRRARAFASAFVTHNNILEWNHEKHLWYVLMRWKVLVRRVSCGRFFRACEPEASQVTSRLCRRVPELGLWGKTSGTELERALRSWSRQGGHGPRIAEQLSSIQST